MVGQKSLQYCVVYSLGENLWMYVLQEPGGALCLSEKYRLGQAMQSVCRQCQECR